MKDKDIILRLNNGAGELGIELTKDSLNALTLYIKELMHWSKRINLTSIKDAEGIIDRHILDSMTIMGFLGESQKILDIGTGAGLPGLIIKILAPEKELTLIDGVGKKVQFLKHMIRTLGLQGIEAKALRAEDPSAISELGQDYDLVISRALTDMSSFIALARPFLRKHGSIIAMKGPINDRLSKELKEIEHLNYELHELTPPNAERPSTIIIIPSLI
jgi:16S rRNA (guanine527-N7)-methyltransferase